MNCAKLSGPDNIRSLGFFMGALMQITLRCFFLLSLFGFADASLTKNESGSKMFLAEGIFENGNSQAKISTSAPVVRPPEPPCVPPYYDSQKSIIVKLTTKPTEQLTPRSRVKVELYGYNKWGADAPATLLTSFIKNISGTPSEVEFAFPNDGYKNIRFIPVECPIEAGYYLDVTIDINGDGKLCDGDLSQDYDLQEPHFFYGDNLATTLEFVTPMHAMTDSICRDF